MNQIAHCNAKNVKETSFVFHYEGMENGKHSTEGKRSS